MMIPDPAAWPEDSALVLNYRMKPPCWEPCAVQDIHYSPPHLRSREDGTKYEVEGRWNYRVWIDRPSVPDKYSGRPRGGGYSIEVGDGSIRL